MRINYFTTQLIPVTVVFICLTNVSANIVNKSSLRKPAYFKDYSRKLTNSKDNSSLVRTRAFPRPNTHHMLPTYSINQKLSNISAGSWLNPIKSSQIGAEIKHRRKRNFQNRKVTKKEQRQRKGKHKSSTEAVASHNEYYYEEDNDDDDDLMNTREIHEVETKNTSSESGKHHSNVSEPPTEHNNDSNLEDATSKAQSTSSGYDNLINIEVDDVIVNYGMPCKKQISDACWLERQVGDTTTLHINISGLIDMSLIAVRWKKMYQMREKRAQISMTMEFDRLPWNMIMGSGGRELRLNPISNSDIDPNSLSAKVFIKNIKKNNHQPYLLLKELLFRIDIPSIDVGEVYYGEEITIYLENFITLPENGNLVIDWAMEKPNNKKEPLPSNVKLSYSGRSIVIKELKKGQLGVISSVIYSSNGITVAKRRFSIQKLVSIDRRRSIHAKNTEKHGMSKRYINKCPHVNRYNTKRLAKYMKPISRKKRYRMDMISVGRRCRRWSNLHSRFTRWAIFDAFDTTLDPRLMPVEKLIALSEESDGTLDDIIPHEVHFVNPVINIVTDSILEYVRMANFEPNCTHDGECGIGAYCIIPEGQPFDDLNRLQKGYCYCLPEYFGDGFKCRKIPMDNHRDKRIKKSTPEVEPVASNLYYSDKESRNKKKIASHTELVTELLIGATESEIPKILEYEEEESYLLSTCLDKKDCSPHALCHQYGKNHPFCKCMSGFRGNGIFCWEIVDYIPVDILDIDLSDSA